jgi:hypothetical protein
MANCGWFDTGIREWTIVGQGMGMAMRGLRPIAELQYLDYLAYAFSPLTDDVATLRYRTKGKAVGAGHYSHSGPSPGRHLAFRLSDWDATALHAGHLCTGAAQYDPGSRNVQHDAPVGRSGDPDRMSEWLSPQREAAR